MLQRITDIITQYIDIDPAKITPETNLVSELCMDSLRMASLVVVLEEEFDIHIPDEAFEDLHTIGDLMNLLSAQA